MVWSDQSQFPFYVIDNNGNIIYTVDATGWHLVGANSRIDASIASGNPYLAFRNIPTTSSAFIQLATPPSSVGIDILAPDGLGGYTRVRVNSNGVFFGDNNNPNIVNQLQYLNSDGFIRLSSSVNPAAGWTNLILKNGWTAAAGYKPPQARLNPLGAVEFQGVITAGTLADGTNIFDVPWAALQPTNGHQLLRPSLAPTGAGSAGSSRLFANSGAPNFYCYGVNAGGTTNIGLNGLSYYP